MDSYGTLGHCRNCTVEIWWDDEDKTWRHRESIMCDSATYSGDAKTNYPQIGESLRGLPPGVYQVINKDGVLHLFDGEPDSDKEQVRRPT